MALYRCWSTSDGGGGSGGNLQPLTVTAETSQRSYSPSSGYDGFDSVTVNPQPHTTSEPSSGYYQMSSNETKEFDLGLNHDKRYVRVQAPSSQTPNLQEKTATVTPTANWSGSETNVSEAIVPDSGYDGMSKVYVKTPMLRDGELLQFSTKTTPGTIYKGDVAESNSKELIRVAPRKNGMSYTNSYLYVDPDEWGGGGTSPTGNAVEANVLAGKTFSNSSGTGKTGTMTNNGALKQHVKWGDKVTIPEGYHDGSGWIWCDSSSTRDILWTNPSPTTSFGSKTITLDYRLYDYDFIGFFYNQSTTYTNQFVVFVFVSSILESGNNSAQRITLSCKGNGGTQYVRNIDYNSSTTLSVKAAYQYSSSTTANTSCIPILIIGYKLAIN